MNRTSLIVIGIMIILLMVGMWGYLLIYGAPEKATDVFTNLGVEEPIGDARVVPAQNNATQETVLPISNAQLQQISNRAVAGFGFSKNSPEDITYMEKGTGHVYKIDTTRGTETLVSPTTIVKTSEAHFSPEAIVFVATMYENYDTKSSIGYTNVQEALTPLPLNAANIAFVDENTLLFTEEINGETIAYSHAIDTKTTTKLFTIGFTDAKMLWGYGIDGMFVQTKPSASLMGYAYKVSETGTLTPLSQTGYGLQIQQYGDAIVASESKGGEYVTELLINQVESRVPVTFLGEKCVGDIQNNAGVWCGTPLGSPSSTYLEDWYKGKLISNDYIWYTTLGTQSATLAVNLEKLASQIIDVVNLKINNDGSLLLFSNKVDNSLWMYKIDR